MMWDVETTETFDNWFDAQTVALKEDLLASMLILAEYGPQLGRPFADTVNDSQFERITRPTSGKPGTCFFCFRSCAPWHCIMCG